MNDSRNDDEAPESPMSRRRALGIAAGLVGGAVLTGTTLDAMTQAPTTKVSGSASASGAAVAPASPVTVPVAPPDASMIPGVASGPLSTRSPFEMPALTPVGITTGASLTPLQHISGTITPSDLHFQRHHNGIAVIDPHRYALTVHGLVDRPLVFSLEQLKRFPAVTRTCFVECSRMAVARGRQPSYRIPCCRERTRASSTCGNGTGVPRSS